MYYTWKFNTSHTTWQGQVNHDNFIYITKLLTADSEAEDLNILFLFVG